MLTFFMLIWNHNHLSMIYFSSLSGISSLLILVDLLESGGILFICSM